MLLSIQNYSVHAGRNATDKVVGSIRFSGQADDANLWDVTVNFVDDGAFHGQVGQIIAPNTLWVMLPERDQRQFYTVLETELETLAEWDTDGSAVGSAVTWFRISANNA